MDQGPYRRSAQAQQGLPLSNLQYGELASSCPSTQAALRHPSSFDGLPRAQSEHHFMTSSSSATSLVPAYNHMNPMSMTMPQPQMWDDQLQMSSFEDQNGHSYYNNYSSFAANDNDSVLDVPRFVPSELHSNSLNDNNMHVAYSPSYIAKSSKPSYFNGSLDRSHLSFNGLGSSSDFARLSISRSPLLKLEHDDMCGDPLQFERAPAFILPSSETSDDGGFSSREMTAVDDGEQTAEEPYAKLIHRALMSAPNHSMVLQEIYQWFRENTIKGSVKDGNKGWMNSIRHNLSMNAVSLPSLCSLSNFAINPYSHCTGIQEDRAQDARRRDQEVHRMGPGRIRNQRWRSIHHTIPQRYQRKEIHTKRSSCRHTPGIGPQGRQCHERQQEPLPATTQQGGAEGFTTCSRARG